MIFLAGVLLGAVGRFRLQPAVFSILLLCIAGPIYYFGIVAGPAMLVELPSAIVSYFIGALIGVWLTRRRRVRRQLEGKRAAETTDALLAKAEANLAQQRKQSEARASDD